MKETKWYCRYLVGSDPTGITGIKSEACTSSITHSGTSIAPTFLPTWIFHVTAGSLSIIGTVSKPKTFEFFSFSSADGCVVCVDSGEDTTIDPPSLTLSFCEFVSCRGGSAGGIALIGERGGTVQLCDCFFTANEGSLSNDVFASASWATSLSSSTVDRCFSESMLNHLVVGESPSNDLLPFSVLLVDADNNNDVKCDQPTVACSSIFESLTHCKQLDLTDNKFALRRIRMVGNLTETQSISVLSKRVIIDALEEDSALMWNPSTSVSLLTVTTGSATLKGFTLIHDKPQTTTPMLSVGEDGFLTLDRIVMDGQQASFSSHLISNIQGTLTLNSVSISNVTLSGNALIEGSGNVVMDDCYFTNIQREEKEAGVLEYDVVPSFTIKVTNTLFTNCKGGDEDRWMCLSSPTAFAFSSSDWEGTFSANSPRLGVTVKGWNADWSSEHQLFSLLYLMYPSSEAQIVISSPANVGDHPLCGSIEMPCQTVEKGVRLTGVRTVEISVSADLSSVLSVGHSSLSVHGRNGKGSLCFSELGQIVSSEESDAGEVILSKLTLDASSSTLTDSSLIMIGSGSLDISSCSLISSKTITSGVFSFHGTFSLTSFTLTPSVISTDADMFVVDTARLTFKDTTLPTLVFSSKSVLNVKGASTVLVSGVTTSSITQSSSSAEGGCFLCVEGQSTASVTISDSQFGDCLTPGHGGWGRCAFGEEGRLVVTQTTFGSLSAGKGGTFLLLSHSDLASVLPSFDLTVFGVPTVLPQTKEEADALLGLVFGKESEESVGSILLYLFPHSSSDDSVHVHSSGHSHSNCGKKQLPCLALPDSLTKAKGEQGIMVDTSLTLLDEIVIVNRTVEITCPPTETMILTLGSSSSFVVEEHTLTFSLITLQLDSSLSSTPFVVCGGSLILTDISSITHSGTSISPTLLSKCVFHVTSGSLSIVGTVLKPKTFEFFSFSSSDGCVVYVDSGDDTTTDPPSLTISFCEFISCHGGSTGGIALVGERGGTVQLSDCFFTANEGSLSKDVFTSGSWATSLSASTVERCFSGSMLNHLVVGESPANDLLPFSILLVDADNNDDAKCDQPSIACSSFSESLKHCTQQELNSKKYALRGMRMVGNLTETQSISVLSKRVIIDALEEDSALSWNPSTSASLLTVTTGSATLKGFTLIHDKPQTTTPMLSVGEDGFLTLDRIVMDGQQASFSSHLISNIQGTLTLTSVTISNINLPNYALIEGSGNVVMDGCDFTNIHRSEKEAGVLEYDVVPSFTIKVTNTMFTNCKGGDEDRWVCLSSPIEFDFKASDWEGTFSANTPRLGVAVKGWNNSWSSEHQLFSLLYLIHPSSAALIVVSTESSLEDHPLCGSIEMPCQTLETGVELTGIRTVEISVSAILSSVLSVGHSSLSVHGRNGKGSLCFSEQGQIVSSEESDSGEVILSKLTLDASSSTLTDSSLIMIGSGSLDISSCSLISSKNITCGVFSVQGSFTLNQFNFTHLNFSHTPVILNSAEHVTISHFTVHSCHFDTLIDANSTASMTIEYSSFTGITQPVEKNTAEGGMCGWETGMVLLRNTTCTLQSVLMTDLDDGAVMVQDSQVTIDSSTFHDNTPNDEVFRSARKNIGCVGESKIVVGSLSGGDGSGDESMWIYSDASCEVWKNKTRSLSPFFVPTLNSSASKAEEVKEKTDKSFSLKIVGSLLIPCDLKLRVFEVKGKEEKNAHSINLSEFATISDWNETSFSVSLPFSSIPLQSDLEWRCQLEYGFGARTENWIRLKLSLSDERKALALNTMKWLGPVLGGVFGLFVLLLVIIIVLCVRRRKQKPEEKPEELTPVDEEKIAVEEFYEGSQLGATGHAIRAVESVEGKTTWSEETGMGMNEKPSLNGTGQGEMIEALSLSNCVDLVRVNKMDTLYRRLHSPDADETNIRRKELQKQLAKGMARLMKADPHSESFTKLTSHWILLSSEKVVLKLRDDAPLPFSCPHPATREPNLVLDNPCVEGGSLVSYSSGNVQKGTKNDDLTVRWQAPEQGDSNKFIDPHKAAVFRLGLVLWEIETGSIPFGETDAVNANRSLCSGMLPKMGTITEKSFVDLIASCLSVNPADRPSLDSVADFFEEKEEKNSEKKEEVQRTMERPSN
ncbi:hypothetical protein BLNAU_17970 [Blattamonas nauphoetae]|uniref:Protein kinase domain-containing protein n=1 Tax=Blattamonas nauphoetae TaxID=2049346 RepID=A0ABQ9X6A6_9EUKA|nr:hypothetical protein BLNAU_17970 [Blattamonas nauphoetae]